MNIRELISFFGFQVDDKGAKKAENVYKALRNLALGVAGVATTAAVGLSLIVREAAAAAGAGLSSARSARSISSA